jgi:hypothetical protein
MGKRILLYGKSVLIVGLASIFSKIPDLEILRGDNLDFREQDTPDLILVDLCDAETARTLPRLCAISGVPLVGIDITANTMTVLSGKSQSAQSAHELMTVLSDVIQQNPKPLPTSNGS